MKKAMAIFCAILVAYILAAITAAVTPGGIEGFFVKF